MYNSVVDKNSKLRHAFGYFLVNGLECNIQMASYTLHQTINQTSENKPDPYLKQYSAQWALIQLIPRILNIRKYEI